MARNNYPQAGLDNMEPAAVQQIVASLRELHELGRPKTDEEVAKRIDDYFDLCQRSSIRPGVGISLYGIAYQQNNTFPME